jgi:hypothetical protein
MSVCNNVASQPPLTSSLGRSGIHSTEPHICFIPAKKNNKDQKERGKKSSRRTMSCLVFILTTVFKDKSTTPTDPESIPKAKCVFSQLSASYAKFASAFSHTKHIKRTYILYFIFIFIWYRDNSLQRISITLHEFRGVQSKSENLQKL